MKKTVGMLMASRKIRAYLNREAISIFLMGVSFPTFDIGLYMNELLQNLLNEPEKKKSPSIRQRNENSTPSAWQARRNDTFLTLS
ncbi:MAG: hypothetical protein ACYDAM_07625 [Leptospirales bacterium]